MQLLGQYYLKTTAYIPQQTSDKIEYPQHM